MINRRRRIDLGSVARAEGLFLAEHEERLADLEDVPVLELRALRRDAAPSIIVPNSGLIQRP